MNNPFKLFASVAIGSILIAVLVGWLMNARPPRDALGTIPILPAEMPAPADPAQTAGDANKGRPPSRPAPAVNLKSLDSGHFSLASYRGKAPVVLYFFATW